MKYTISIKEMLRRDVEVEAESREAALSFVERMYRDSAIVLGADDYVSTEFGCQLQT